MDIDISKLKTVCCILGPYRNLTTLTAAIVALHPDCQVLNHASDRILGKPPGEMFTNYSDANFERFVEFALLISGSGKRGRYGGSITLSHAFDHHIVRHKYEQRYGKKMIKENIRCLFWKESMRLNNYIRYNQVSLEDLISKNSKLKFLMPIRNPLDCAISNLKSGHATFFQGLNDYSVENVLDFVIKEISWFLDLRKDHPDRFFYYFENEFTKRLVISLANFLQVKPDDDWIHDSLDCFQLIKPYQYNPGLIDHYHKVVKKHLTRHPRELEKLTSLVP